MESNLVLLPWRKTCLTNEEFPKAALSPTSCQGVHLHMFSFILLTHKTEFIFIFTLNTNINSTDREVKNHFLFLFLMRPPWKLRRKEVWHSVFKCWSHLINA